ncbi:peptidase M23 [Pilimelia anulata]|uniref:Peptidase M23 n=1 Tax=Pilimelia anulata TaxID=53371 RepID=A0A8J3BF99_9ACTN|nr:LysM peptidoglycan-binding domain-containing protein [Pilimelia anulata]GGK10030.1 peptidase M23 [Pilimelia anulata]
MPGPTGKVAARLQRYQPPAAGGSRPGGPLGGPIVLSFNPNQLTLSKAASWIPHVVRSASDVGIPEFSGSEPRTLQLEVFLDVTDSHARTVAERVEELLSCCSPTAASVAAKAPSPPWVRFSWGQFRSVSFYAYASSVNAVYSLFNAAGTPLRATCSLTLTEISVPVAGQNPTSGARSSRRVHRTVAGDSLPLLAHREYGDPTAWRRIAEANGIDDPMRLRPGTPLLIPAAGEAADG